jgi:predicted thioesterase
MTTNRTGKPGDEIFCTPMMIEHMNEIVSKNLTTLSKAEFDIRTLKIVCAHKAPLALGKSFTLKAKVEKVAPETAEFRVLCVATDNQKVIGDATITLKAFEQ